MNRSFAIFLTLLTTLGCTVSKNENKHTSTVIESIKFESDLFTEIIVAADTSIENGTFNKIQFIKTGRVVFELYDEDSYDTIKEDVIEIKNEASSKNILLQKVKNKYYITLFGAEYGCCPRELTIIQADETG